MDIYLGKGVVEGHLHSRKIGGVEEGVKKICLRNQTTLENEKQETHLSRLKSKIINGISNDGKSIIFQILLRYIGIQHYIT